MLVRPAADWSVADVADGWAQGLRSLGVEVVEDDWGSRVITALHMRVRGRKVVHNERDACTLAGEWLLGAWAQVRPDLVLVIGGWDVPHDVWQTWISHGQPVTVHHTESPYNDDRHVAMAWTAGLHLVNDMVGAEKLKAVGAKAFYAPHCYRPDVHHPGSGPRSVPFAFVGSGFSGRREFLAATPWHDDVVPLLAGHWPLKGDEVDAWIDTTLPSPMDNRLTADLYRRTVTSVNLYRADLLDREDAPELADGWSMGPREVELAACGVWFARQSRAEGDRLLPMLPIVDDPGDLADVVRWALTHPEARQRAADAAREALAPRTFTWLAGQFLERIGVSVPRAA